MYKKFVLGEFGVVYKGHITTNLGKVVKETVAIKTTKGMTDEVSMHLCP